MIYLEEVLSKVFADSTTKAVKANNNIMVSCDKDYYLPLYICDKKNVKLPSFSRSQEQKASNAASMMENLISILRISD